MKRYSDPVFVKNLVCSSVFTSSIHQGSAFFASLFLTLLLTSIFSFCFNSQKPLLYLSALCSIVSFAILAFDIESSIIDPVLTSEILFGISAAINPMVVMDYLLKFIGLKFRRAIGTVQVIETMMGLSIPVYAIISKDKGLIVHMEALCVIGMLFSIVSVIITMFILVEFPSSSSE